MYARKTESFMLHNSQMLRVGHVDVLELLIISHFSDRIISASLFQINQIWTLFFFFRY
ncbi:hypothetical protein C1646_702989, partial [Rhizophagus diaphanus]